MALSSSPTAHDLCQSARQAMEQGQLEQAQELVQQALVLEPESFEAHRLMSALYVQQEQLAEGVQALRTAAHLRPGDAAVHYELGLLLRQAGRLEEAIDELDATLRLDPDHRLARVVLKALRPETDAPTPSVREEVRRIPRALRAEEAPRRDTLLTLAQGVITSPEETLERRLVEFADSPRALYQMAGFYAVSLAVWVVVVWFYFLPAARMMEDPARAADIRLFQYCKDILDGLIGVGPLSILCRSLFALFGAAALIAVVGSTTTGGRFKDDFPVVLARLSLVRSVMLTLQLPLLLLLLLGAPASLWGIFLIALFLLGRLWLDMVAVMVTYDYEFALGFALVVLAEALTMGLGRAVFSWMTG